MDHNDLDRMRNNENDQEFDGDYVLDYNSHIGAVGRRTVQTRQANENVGGIPLFNHMSNEQTVWQRQSTYNTREESKSQQSSQSPSEHRFGSHDNAQMQHARQNPIESPRGSSNLLTFEIDRQPFRRSDDLDKWKYALGNVPEAKILPLLGGQADLNYLSWKGEHFLNCEAVKVIDKEFASNFKTKGKATKILATAFSPSFLAINKTDILLDYMWHHTTESDLNIGTVVEAAVSVIYDTNEEAVRDLARYLLRKAENVPTPNAKGSLLQVGGEVTIIKKEGSSHQPFFTARAELDNQVAEAKANSKKKAEQLACERLLDHLGL